MLKCNACGGTYEPVQADGSLYFHACPPLSDPEVGKALGLSLDSSTWTAPQKAAVAAAARVRPNARDENLVQTSDPTKPATMKAIGAGVTTVP